MAESNWLETKGPSINDVTVLGEGVKDFVTTLLRPQFKTHDDGGSGSQKMFKIACSSFMDDP